MTALSEENKPAIPFQPRDRVILDIHDVAFGGEGVARLSDFVVFVPFVIPGERVEAEIVEVKKSFARAQLVRLIHASPNRVTPRCPYFGDCGGCQYQHVSYPAQTELKHKQISDLFQRIGGFAHSTIAPVVPCPKEYGYRNRIMLRSQWDKFKKGLNIGYVRYDNRLVVDVEQCPIAEPALNEQIQKVRANPPPKGGLKVVLRMMPEGWELAEHSFFQNNFHLLPELVNTVRSRIQDGGCRHLIDVYCGVGFFSLECADLIESFVGIEFDKQAVHAARKNAVARHRTNGQYLFGSAEELLPQWIDQFAAEHSCVLLDPPRRGCAPDVIELLRRARPAQIIYVSCHPATLARDLHMLCLDGVYELSTVVPLDMFPQTQHVECVADLRLKAARAV